MGGTIGDDMKGGRVRSCFLVQYFGLFFSSSPIAILHRHHYHAILLIVIYHHHHLPSPTTPYIAESRKKDDQKKKTWRADSEHTQKEKGIVIAMFRSRIKE